MSRTAPPSSVTPNGLLRVQRVGSRRRGIGDLYHFLLDTKWRYLFLLAVLSYVAVNALFGAVLWLVPGSVRNAVGFWDHFNFSVQTLSTVGYGDLVPVGRFANTMVTLEGMVGFFALALATGLVFSKFSRPTARVMFSREAVVSPYDGQMSLMVRLANRRNNRIFDASVKLHLLVDTITREGDRMRRFFDMKLLREYSPMFSLSWTAVHPIDVDSPIHGLTIEDLRARNAQIVVSIGGVDDTFAQPVHARYFYGVDDLRWGYRFADVITTLPQGRLRIDYGRFHQIEPARPPSGS